MDPWGGRPWGVGVSLGEGRPLLRLHPLWLAASGASRPRVEVPRGRLLGSAAGPAATPSEASAAPHGRLRPPPLDAPSNGADGRVWSTAETARRGRARRWSDTVSMGKRPPWPLGWAARHTRPPLLTPCTLPTRRRESAASPPERTPHCEGRVGREKEGWRVGQSPRRSTAGFFWRHRYERGKRGRPPQW